MASTRQKNGKWYYRITVSSDGKTKYIERGSYETKEEALSAGEMHEKRIKIGNSIFIPKKITYEDMAREWLISYAPTNYKESTLSTHTKVLKNYILPRIGEFDISAIDTKMLQDIINSEIPNHTWHGLKRIQATLNKTFDYAIKNGYLQKNPSENIEMPKLRSIKGKELRPSRKTDTCSRELVSAIFKRFPEGHPCHIPLLLGYRAGLRLGEVYGLLIDDIDLTNKKLYVRRQIQFNKNNELYFTDPKYCLPGEYRVVDLDNDTCKRLSRHIDKIKKGRVLGHKQYYISKDNIVNEEKGEPIDFLNVRYADGTYITPRTMMHASRVIHGKESYFDMVDTSWEFHEFRHTHTSECIAAGMPPESVQKRLGHKNLTTTYKFYVHETKDQADKAKAILEEMYV